MRLEIVQGTGNAKSASQQEEMDWRSWKKSKRGKKRRKSKRDESSSGTESSSSSSESSSGKKGRKKERKRQKEKKAKKNKKSGKRNRSRSKSPQDDEEKRPLRAAYERSQLQWKVLRELQGVTQFATEEPRQTTPRRRPSRGAQCERAEPKEEPVEMVPERRVAETPTTQVAQVSDKISPACKDMLELRINGVLDTEKIKTRTEAQAQLEALPMRQLSGILEKLPGVYERRHQRRTSRRHCAEATHAFDKLKRRQQEKRPVRKFKPAGDAECMDPGAAVVAHLLVRVHVWSVDHGPRESCRILRVCLCTRAREQRASLSWE